MFVPFSPTLFLFLHDLRHEIAHLFGGALLHLPRDVGVGAEREASVVVTQHGGNGLHIHAVLQRCCRECMPIRYNYDKPENPVLMVV